MTERETALAAAQVAGGPDADVLRRADLFWRFINDTPACQMSLIFGNVLDPLTNLSVGGVVPIIDGHVTIASDRSFTCSAAVTGLDGDLISNFTTAVDDPDIADVSMPYSDGRTVLVVPTGEGTATITIADANFSFSFIVDVVAP